MQTETGEIRKYEDIPKEELKEELGKWSEPFSLDEIVDFKGVRMKIIKIKKARKQIHLQFAGK